MYPIYYTLFVNISCGALYRGWWRWCGTAFACIMAILATLLDYGTNGWSVGFIGFLTLSLFAWINAYAPEFADVASVGGFCYVYVCWASYAKAPDPSTFEPGKSGGVRLAMVTLGILIGLFLYATGRPKYSKKRVRLHMASILFDLEAIFETFLIYAQRPEMLGQDLSEKTLRKMLQDANLALEAGRTELDSAGGEPNVVYPWSTSLYQDLFYNVSDMVARLTTAVNYYEWLARNFNAGVLLQGATSTVFSDTRITKVAVWNRTLATCLETQQPIVPFAPRMQEICLAMVHESAQFREALRAVSGQDVPSNIKELAEKLSPEEKEVRLATSAIALLLICSYSAYLTRIEEDMIRLYGTRLIGTPIGIRID